MMITYQILKLIATHSQEIQASNRTTHPKTV